MGEAVTDVRTKRREQIAGLAEKDFSDHVLTEVAPHQWLCAKPGTGAMSFYVAIVGTNHAVITGDIGSIVWSPFRGALGFLRSNGSDPLRRIHCGYPMSKVCGGAPREFNVDEASECLREEAAEHDDDRSFDPSEVRGMWDGETLASWWEACIAAGIDEPDSCEDYTSTALLCWHAARCWARLMDAAEVAK